MSEKDRGNLYAVIDSCDKIRDFTDKVWDAATFYADNKTLPTSR